METILTDRRWTSMVGVFSNLRPIGAANLEIHLVLLKLSAGFAVSEGERRMATEAVAEAVAEAERTLRRLVVLEKAGACYHCSHDRNAPPTVETSVAMEGYHPRWFFLSACELSALGLRGNALKQWWQYRQQVREFHQGKRAALSTECRLWILEKLIATLSATPVKYRRRLNAPRREPVHS